MARSDIKREILYDNPSSEDLFHGKGHERTALLLSRIIAKFGDSDRAIGLDGAWGSGKSSVVGMADRMLSNQNDKRRIKFNFFTFDIWNAQGTTFRRSFLEHFISWAQVNYKNKADELENIKVKVRGKTRETKTKGYPILGWYGLFILLLTPFIPFYYFWAKSEYDKVQLANKSIQVPSESLSFLSTWPFKVAVLFLLLTLFAALITSFLDKGMGDSKRSRFKQSLSKLLLITSRRHEDQNLTQHIRETDPNDFEFQSIFRDVLRLIQSKSNKVVVVLDNIDRLPANEIADHWAKVRSLFTRTASTVKINENDVITIIVPYERLLIENALEINKKREERGDLVDFVEREIFIKTFDEILTVSPPVMSSAKEFFQRKFLEALPEFSSRDEIFRAYQILLNMDGTRGAQLTPRRIIHFINELSGMYALHEGVIPVPTIAFFISHRDRLEQMPTVLTDKQFGTDKMRKLASNPELERDLASLIYNVEQELAFEILLDDQIEAAIVNEDSENLIEVSNNRGFDFRIDDVVQNNVDAWVSVRRHMIMD